MRHILALALAASLGLGLGTGAGDTAAAACSIDGLADDARLRDFRGYVSDADTGERLFTERGDTPAPTGSVLKVLTATAALEVLGGDYRLKTRVVEGKAAGTIVLVGRGDPTLSRVSSSFYPGAPTLSALAASVKRNYDGKIRQIVVDSSYWDDSDSWSRTWARSEQRIGYMSEVSALQVDGDRDNPGASTSHRSTNPAERAGRWFAEALGVPRARVVAGTARSGARTLGVARSQPLTRLIRTMLLTSDNSLAESIARVTSRVAGEDGSRASLRAVVASALAGRGLDTRGVRVYDGSGLSTRNRVSPKFVTELMRELPASVRSSLPVAGRTGSLAWRFTGASAVARGHVRAKTGWLETEYSLAGLVDAVDGSRQAFAFYAIGDGISSSATAALDALAAGVYRCGASLG
jgi:D-alanyl-D-alanine carboxypeptidase/D-alanyl-D-alanine-endopeptidase (penicillin-binding protein 4)